ncbi:hypothetical protein LEP1GSC163_3003 [Leptospira santarosai str. CBC379]|uniref:Uncharacterized protein n=1 Tax=Leptospira santarosai serovar Arenal str. MAVJ 401 TaxID=1049976 RepID=M6JTS5_9LEPT|nr:hypothetical protein LEP1GSC163_3003 [Leptospira santarosai str. CBC379]EMN22970.1 hypothetical protein LEP1GSC063_3440 [Leptospira santarosai serovar Arenal str. MAVJ 401]
MVCLGISISSSTRSEEISKLFVVLKTFLPNLGRLGVPT